MGGKGGIGCALLCVIVVQNPIFGSAGTARHAVPARGQKMKNLFFVNFQPVGGLEPLASAQESLSRHSEPPVMSPRWI